MAKAACESLVQTERPDETEGSLRDELNELNERVARLHRGLHAARMGAWEFDTRAGKVWWSPTLEGIHGIPEGSFAGTVDAYLQDIHPDDLPRVLRILEAIRTEPPPVHHLEYRIVRPDGEVRWLEAHGHFERGPDGEIDRLVGVCMDTTDRKQIEAARDAAVERSQRLVTITAAIADAVTRAQVYEAVVDQVGAALATSSAGLWLRHPDEGNAVLVHSTGYGDAARAAISGLPIDGPLRLPILDCMRTGAPLWITSQHQLLADYPHLAPIVSPGRGYRISCLPIRAGDRVIGALGFTFEREARFDSDERDFLVLMARYCAQALERLRMLEVEAASRSRAEAAAARMALLNRASLRFARVTPDLPALLRAIVAEVNTEYADCCGITLVPEEGDDLEVVAVQSRDPEGTSLARAVLEARPPRRGEGLSGTVAVTGEGILVAEVHPSLFQSAAYTAYAPFTERYLPRSIVVVPLRTRGRIVGVLSAMRTSALPLFTEDDKALLQDLADRAALALDNSRLHLDNQQARSRAELLYRLAAGLIGAAHVDELFEIALDGLQEALGAERCSILGLDADGVMRFRAWRGLSEPYRLAVEGHSPWSPEVRDPQVIVVCDVARDLDLAAFLPWFQRESIGALAFVPLVAEDRLIGKFMVYFGEPRELGPHEIEMAVAIANHVAAAISRFAALGELRQAVRFNEMFTAMLGHDLRNPLNAIVTGAQLALMRSDDERLTTPLSRVLNAAGRMARMIDHLLDFTRVRVGAGIPLNPAPLDLEPVVRQVIDEIDHASRAIRLERAGDATGKWDSDRLSQVFSNLVANAVRHGTPDGCATVRIDGSSPDLVRVEVHNHGTIPPEVMPNLFEPMAGEPRRHRSDGLGLGLFISQQILKSHGGRIDVRSSAERGTSFTVVLPRHPSPGAHR